MGDVHVFHKADRNVGMKVGPKKITSENSMHSNNHIRLGKMGEHLVPSFG